MKPIDLSQYPTCKIRGPHGTDHYILVPFDVIDTLTQALEQMQRLLEDEPQN